MSSTPTGGPNEAQVAAAPQIESNKAAAHKQSAREPNNNDNVNENGHEECESPVSDHKAPADAAAALGNSSPRRVGSSESERRDAKTRAESDQNNLHDKRRSQRSTGAAERESSAAGEASQRTGGHDDSGAGATKVKSSSDRAAVAAGEERAHGPDVMSAQGAASAGAEDAARDKRGAEAAPAAVAVPGQVEQTRGARQQLGQQQRHERRTSGRDSAAAQVEAAGAHGQQAQGQGQGREAAGAKTNIDQNKPTAALAAADLAQTRSDAPGDLTNATPSQKARENTSTSTTTTSTSPTTNNNKNNNDGHHILELNNNINHHQHQNQQNHHQRPPGSGARLSTAPIASPAAAGGLNNSNYLTKQHGHHQHQHHTTTTTTNTKRLSYLQALLLRRWPCLALAICIMSSLLFGILLSAATVYLMHGFTNCNAELAHLASLGAGPLSSPTGGVVGGHHNQHLHHHHHQVNFLPAPSGLNADAPLDAAGGVAGPGPDAVDSVTRRLGPDAGDDKQLTNKTSIPQAPQAAFQRLPSSVVPQHYNLFIWPHITEPAFPFNGSLEIHLTCKSATQNITLHNIDLDIAEESIGLSKLAPATAARGRRQVAAATAGQEQAKPLAAGPRVARLSQDKQLQYSIIHLDAPLEAGQDYLLRLDFSGALNDDLAGFYRMKYERQNSSEPTWIAATQFQATDARRAFPCFDEPLYKATFSIKIRHWTNMTALSNMPIVKSEKSSDGLWITDTFAKSQRMSTYLVAFAVTNFESRTAGNITVWTRPGFVHTAEYALRIAERILRHYEDFFGIAYPLPKMDMIALPDFNAGAMENWGLITYRETAMLYDPESSSVANKQRVAVVVAHELAHQWFGNLVTPKWWDDLWLNEGFASFVEYLGVDHVEPKWRMLDQFVVEEVQNVFKLDSLSSSHQISIPVNNPDEISEIFDHISYAKGASIIRMMNYFLTPEVFKQGLQRYLRALKYNNAEQSDLWSHLTVAKEQLARASNSSTARSALATSPQAAGNFEPIDVGQVMNSWTLQTGYPLVTLTRNYASDAPSAKLEQVRYQPYKILVQDNQQQQQQVANRSLSSAPTAAALAGPAGQRWEIPITYTWKSEQNWEPNTRLWLHQNQSGPVEIRWAPGAGPKSPSEWLLLNVQQVGYYRVNYDVQNWRLLVGQLQEDHTKIGTTNRAQLLDDLFELAKSSLIDYQLAMESTKYLAKERDYLPWESVLLSFGYIDEMLQRTPLYGDWQDYFARVIEPYYARYKDLNWTKQQQAAAGARSSAASSAPIDSNDVLEQYNQVNAVSWACQTNNPHCIDKAKRVFGAWRETGVNNILPGMRYAAYCAAIEYGTKDDWNFLWRVYEREQGATERDRILRALGCSKEMWILSRYLEWIFDKSKPIRRQDGAFVFRMIAKNNYGRDLAFNFMRERWATVREYYGKTSFTLGHLIKSVATSMNTQVELDQLKRFHESIKNDIGNGKRSFQIAIEEVESNLYWRNKNYKILESWLAENHKERAKQRPLHAAAA